MYTKPRRDGRCQGGCMISNYFVWFIIASFLGWVWETIYCTIKEKSFQNRGFLFGPVCPIYGTCVTVLRVLISLMGTRDTGELPVWMLFLICMIGSAIAEYATSWYLEKRFHARWWDYSRIPLNINGRICLPVSVLFGVAGVALVKYAMPGLQSLSGGLPSYISYVYEGLGLVMAGLLGADIALTEASMSRLLEYIENTEKEFSERGEKIYLSAAGAPKQLQLQLDRMNEDVRKRTEKIAGILTRPQKYTLQKIKLFRPAVKEKAYYSIGNHLKRSVRNFRTNLQNDTAESTGVDEDSENE